MQSKSKKVKVEIDLTQDDAQIVDFNAENQRLSLRERQLEIEEREIKLKHERIELLKLKKELNIL